MSDLISRSDVIKIIDEEIQAKSDYLQHNAQIDIMYKVQELPTVEAKPVVRGEWIPRNPNNEDSERYCSNCKAEISAIKAMYYKFCPECGCNMRGKKND